MKYKEFETLRKNKDFQRVYKNKNSKGNSFFVVYVKENDTDDIYPKKKRLGISVSKKVGNSVIRHRLSRQIREIFKKKAADIKKVLDIVVVIKPECKGRSYSELEKSFTHILGKHGLINKE